LIRRQNDHPPPRAILAADVVGFSAMMEQDEEGKSGTLAGVEITRPIRHQARLPPRTRDRTYGEELTSVAKARLVERKQCGVRLHQSETATPSSSEAIAVIGVVGGTSPDTA
jgi:hypothetical protein